MLNVTHRGPEGGYPQEGGVGGGGGFELIDLLAIIRRHKLLIFLSIATFLFVGVLYILTTPKMYTAQATMLIDPRRVQLFRQDSVTSDLAFDPATVESQIETLKSERVAIAVVKNLRLIDDPEFTGPPTSLIAVLTIKARGLFDAPEPPTEEAKIRQAVGVIKDRLEAKRSGVSYAIQISFTSLSPSKAATIANEVADAYLTDQLESKYELTQRASAWLQGRIRELRQQATDAEKATLDFRAENKIVDASGKLMNDQQMTESNTQLTAARAATQEARARLDRIQEIARSGVADAGVADMLRNEVITRLRQQYLDSLRREQDFAARFGAMHQQTVQLRAETKQYERLMTEEVNRMVQSFQSDYEIAKAREEALQQSILKLFGEWAETRSAQLRLRELEGAAQSYRTLYDTFMQRYLLAVQQQSFPISDARVITTATPPTMAAYPRTGLVLAGALVLGLGLGCAGALASELLDRRVRTTRQVETASSVVCLGVLPLQPTRARHERPGPKPSGAPAQTFALPTRLVAGNITLKQPFSLYAETVRNIKVSIDMARLTRPVKSLGVISSLAGEGKTTVAMNLAIAIAQSGQRVLLIDADMRSPRLTRTYTPQAKGGLVEVLSGDLTLDAAVWTESSTGVRVLPAVIKSKLRNTSELLASEAMRALIEQASAEYQYVLLDCPPVLPVVDVRAASPLIDAFVLTVAWGETPLDSLERVASFDYLDGKLLGCVLSKVNMKSYKLFENYDDNYYLTPEMAKP